MPTGRHPRLLWRTLDFETLRIVTDYFLWGQHSRPSQHLGTAPVPLACALTLTLPHQIIETCVGAAQARSTPQSRTNTCGRPAGRREARDCQWCGHARRREGCLVSDARRRCSSNLTLVCRGAAWTTDPVVADMLRRGIVKPPPDDQDDAAPRVEA